MSRYVRTKEYIYDLNAKGIRNCVPIEDGKKIKVLQTVLSNGKPVYDALDVLNESDIIEELFDTLVYRKALYKFYNLPYGAEDTEVYGAIWNDKGLIYVAKMNEEGDWVLL